MLVNLILFLSVLAFLIFLHTSAVFFEKRTFGRYFRIVDLNKIANRDIAISIIMSNKGEVNSGMTSWSKVAVMVPGTVTVAVVVLDCVFAISIPGVALQDKKW